MELVLKGRGLRITSQMRHHAEAKLAKISKDPRVTWLEVEVIREHNPRIEGSHVVEVACERGPRVFRARAAGQDVDGALDQVVGRLERQMARYREKMKTRRHAGPIV